MTKEAIVVKKVGDRWSVYYQHKSGWLESRDGWRDGYEGRGRAMKLAKFLGKMFHLPVTVEG